LRGVFGAELTGILHKPEGKTGSWALAVALTVFLLALTTAVFWSTAASAVVLWASRSAYNHGFLIIPISLYLIWDKRHLLRAIEPRPFYPGLLVIFASALAWLIAHSTNILEGEHFALVGMFQGIVMTVFGLALYRAMILPMTFLWLMVPTGTIFYGVLQKIATVISVFLLKITGIPVFSEGVQVEVPSATYIIAPGCSGLNFILTGLAMSLLYAYIMYTGLRKRLIAIGVMLFVALIANAFRIYFIIALAEWTDRKVDIVDDHLLYGWGFFAVILALMGWFGMRYADPVKPMRTDRPAAPVRLRPLLVASVVVLIGVLSAPFYSSAFIGKTRSEARVEIFQPIDEVWSTFYSGSRWAPGFRNANGELRGRIDADPQIEIYLAYYASQWPGHELIANGNVVYDQDFWRQASVETRSIETPAGKVDFNFVRVRSLTSDRLVAYTYWVGGEYSASALQAKVNQALASLLRKRPDAAVIAVSLPMERDIEATTSLLIDYLSKTSLYESLDFAAKQGLAPLEEGG
jgi:exosortase A